jgi:hypothetical protein
MMVAPRTPGAGVRTSACNQEQTTTRAYFVNNANAPFQSSGGGFSR